MKKIICIFCILILFGAAVPVVNALTLDKKIEDEPKIELAEDREIYIGKMSIHPGSVWNGYSPDVKADVEDNIEETIYLDRYDKITFTADWKIRHDTPLFWEDWTFWLEAQIYQYSGWYQFEVEDVEIIDDVGPDDAGSGTLKLVLNYEEHCEELNRAINKNGELKIKFFLSPSYCRPWNGKLKCWSDSDSTKAISIFITGNKPPETPTIKGPSEIEVDKMAKFYAQTTDPENEQIYYGWDFNDDQIVDSWSPYPLNSGKEWCEEKIFRNGGTHKIRVKARDTPWYDESGWSEPIILTVTKTRDKSKSFIPNCKLFFRNNVLLNLFENL